MTDHIEPTQTPELPREVFWELLEKATKQKQRDTVMELAHLACAAGAKAGAKDEYQRGADAELKACCEWLHEEQYPSVAIDLCSARRPKPPSLKEQALEAFEELIHDGISNADVATIRRALESLPDPQ